MATIWISLLINVAMFVIKWIYDNWASATDAQRAKIQRAVSICAAMQRAASEKMGIEPDANITQEFLEKARRAKEPTIPASLMTAVARLPKFGKRKLPRHGKKIRK